MCQTILTVIHLGNRDDHSEDKEPKVILVNAGGTIEMHGQPKLSWTKLTATVQATGETTALFDHKVGIIKTGRLEQCITIHFDVITDNLR